FPKTAPLPPAKSLIHRIPSSEHPRQIAPRDAGAGAVEDRLHEQPVRCLWWGTGGRFDLEDNGFQLFPDVIREQQPHVVHDAFPCQVQPLIHTTPPVDQIPQNSSTRPSS